MKKLLFGLVATIMLSVTGNAQDINSLNSDIDFVKYTNNENNFISKMTDANLLKQINSDGMLSEDELPLFYKLFSTTEEAFSTYLNTQNLIMKTLEEKYKISSYPQKTIQNILNVEFTEVMSVNETTAKLSCRQRFLAEVGAAASVGYFAGLACNGAVFGGPIAYYACHGAVALGLATAGVIAQDNYEECIKKR